MNTITEQQPSQADSLVPEEELVIKHYFCYTCNKEQSHLFEQEALNIMGIVCQECDRDIVEDLDQNDQSQPGEEAREPEHFTQTSQVVSDGGSFTMTTRVISHNGQNIQVTQTSRQAPTRRSVRIVQPMSL